MTKIKLNDMQLVLLSTAAQRTDGGLLPPPEQFAGQAARVYKAIVPLLKQALVEEVPTVERAKIWRDENEAWFTVVITTAGRTAIGVGDGETAGETPPPSPPASPEPPAPPSPSGPARESKTAQVLALLRRAEGVTLDELVAATSWLPHSARAALTGLRKKGHSIIFDKSGERHCYRLVEGAPA